MFWNSVEMLSANIVKVLNATELFIYKMVNFMSCEFHLK